MLSRAGAGDIPPTPEKSHVANNTLQLVIIADFEWLYEMQCRQNCYFWNATSNRFKVSVEKANDSGLVRPHRMNQCIKVTMRKVMAIGYLPIPLMRNNFRAIEQSRRTTSLLCTIFSTALATHISSPMLPFFQLRGNWNVHNWNLAQTREPTTMRKLKTITMHCEIRHPSLWVFIRVLNKDQQAEVENSMTAAKMGDDPSQ
ncbi:hypothetical protein PoB_003978000 [Plakobranchus ocellatus]|uniref:Uncharacterized protein n=1 Tax=Plakobranchus ocellatus TaxID=259542 RepID=A0AAV4B2I2_9GAST|nr:hypothetical protein PoB_003978000 [Plakobranchus ocellatus]